MNTRKAPRQVGRGTLAVLAAVLPMLVAACGSNRLPPNPLPPGDPPKALPGWYPERPWSARDGSSRVMIEGKIVFETDKAVIRPGSEKVLNTLLKFMQEHTEVTVLRVEGHTDDVATDEYNQELSARRSLAVCDWLVDHQIDNTRLLAVGFGEGKPIAPNTQAEGRAENRRTEFHVVEISGRLFQTKDPTAGGYSLTVLSAEERKKQREKVAAPTAAPPPPFRPTGDEVKELGAPLKIPPKNGG